MQPASTCGAVASCHEALRLTVCCGSRSWLAWQSSALVFVASVIALIVTTGAVIKWCVCLAMLHACLLA